MKTRFLALISAFVLSSMPISLSDANSSEPQGRGASHGAADGSKPADTGRDVHWGYAGADGPGNWAKLSAAFEVCESGYRQSPVDLTGRTPADLSKMWRRYGGTLFEVVNNGHTIQVDVQPGHSLRVADKTFELAQFHFHSPSEHAQEGRRYPMEAHFVHKSAQGELAVIGVFMKVGRENPFLEPIWAMMPRNAGGRATASEPLANLNSFFPAGNSYARYFGSLTTPPCSEGVNWYVMDEPVEISSDQLAQFQNLIGENARPLQSAHERFLLSSD